MSHAVEPSIEAVRITEIEDPTALGELFGALQQDLVQLEDRPLRARRVMVNLHDSTLVLQSTSHRVRTLTRIHPELVAFVAIGKRARGTINGQALRADQILVCAPGAEAEIVVEAGYRSISVLMRPEVAAPLLESPDAGGDAIRLDLEERHPVSTGGARRFFETGHRMAETGARAPIRFDARRATRQQAHAEIVSVLAEALWASVHAEPPAGTEATRREYSRIVRLAQRYAEDKRGVGFRVEDLCEVVGTSRRTLQNAFNEILGMSPIAYLNRVRLHRVRRDLGQARRAETTVSTVAMNWGFWHLGDFSRAYRNCFGELPSRTLRRRPEQSR